MEEKAADGVQDCTDSSGWFERFSLRAVRLLKNSSMNFTEDQIGSDFPGLTAIHLSKAVNAPITESPPGGSVFRRYGVRWTSIPGHEMTRIVMLGGAALVSGVLFRVSYLARSAMMALAGLCIIYTAVLLLIAFCYFVFRGAAWTVSWVRLQTQHRNRVTGDWVYVLIQPGPAIAKPVPRIP